MIAGPEIKRVIEMIDQRIQSLQTVKNMLITEFFGEQQIIPFASQSPTPEIADTSKTRKEVLKDFLTTRGPSRRKDILTETKMPKGTVAFLLNDKETFQRLSDGRWRVRE